MFISQIFATTWLAFSLGQAVHDDYPQRRNEVSTNFIIGDDDNFCSGFNCGENCWRPLWCKMDTKSCPGGVTLRRCGSPCRFPRCPKPELGICPTGLKTCPDGTFLKRDPVTCQFPQCPQPVCPTDVKTCPDGTTLNRNPNTCQFPQCPTGYLCPTGLKTCPDGTFLKRDPVTCQFPQCPPPATCSPSLGFHTCPDGTVVGRDPNNLCITFKLCPILFRCANGWQQIPMDRVCDGLPDCYDESDEWSSHGCMQFGVGRRLEDDQPKLQDQEDAFDLKLESTDALDERRRQRGYNCFTMDFKWRWSLGKQRWCCDRHSIACQYLPRPTPAPAPRHNCYTRERWTAEKRNWCCANLGLGCRDNTPTPAPETYNCYTREAWGSLKRNWCCANLGLGCRDTQNEYTPGGEYNCYYGRPSSWTWQKQDFCCSSQGIGCNSGGPSIGGRRAEVELNEDPEEE